MTNSTLQMQDMQLKFWERVKKTDKCWEWTGAHNSKGYGHLWINGRNVGAHRISWFLHYGAIPYGMVICHHCDNSSCVNPDHLFIGTQKDNLADREVKGRTPKGDKSGRRLKPEKYPIGPNHPQAKFTSEQVRWIRLQYLTGKMSQMDMARQFGVAKNTIFNMINGLTYQNVV